MVSRWRAWGAGALVCLALGARDVQGQTRFEVSDQNVMPVGAGMRILDVRDNVRKACYLVFISEPRSANFTDSVVLPNIEDVAVMRDRRLSDLLRAFEGQWSMQAGTPAPNPMGYNWQATSVQLQFALTVVQNAIVRLEQHIDRLAGSSASAMTVVSEPCAPAPRAP